MRKNYSFYVVSLVIYLFAFSFFGYLADQTEQYLGLFGDGGSVCIAYHFGNTNYNTIATDIPATGMLWERSMRLL